MTLGSPARVIHSIQERLFASYAESVLNAKTIELEQTLLTACGRGRYPNQTKRSRKMNDRRWITRDEIAEIHEAIAAEALREAFVESEISNRMKMVIHSQDHKNRATVIREIDSMVKSR